MEIVEYRGIRGLVCAEVITDTSETFECGAPFEVAGTAKLSRTTENSTESHYYDNKPAIIIDTVGADEVTIECSALELDTLAKVTGYTYDETKHMLIEGERENKYFAIGYITELTNGDEIYVWRLKGKFNIPDSSHSTKTDGADAEGQELTFTGVHTSHKFAENNNRTAKAVNVNATKNTTVKEAEFFGTVQTPDTVGVVNA